MAVQKLHDLDIQKASSLLNVDYLKEGLELIQYFTRDAAEKKEKDEMIKKWISDLRYLAWDIEDAIESFNLRNHAPRQMRGLLGACSLGQDIESIQKKLKDIDQRRTRYGIQILNTARTVPSELIEPKQRVDSSQRDKRVAKSLEENVEILLKRAVLGKEDGLCLAWIVGEDGIGKSMVAREVYNHAVVRERFDFRAWVAVSSAFSTEEILKQLLQQFEPRQDTQTITGNLSEESLEEKVRDFLGHRRRYFIVLDDVRQKENFECIAEVFEPYHRDKTCMLLITSREMIMTGLSIHMERLDYYQGWKLFQKIVFDENYGRICSRELEEVGTMLVDKCNGLPLAIRVMGGVLLKENQSVSRWNEVLYVYYQSYREAGDDAVSAIWELSYRYMPPFIKYCFLYLSFFKEGAEINVQRLIALWIAEGIVLPKEYMTMEDIAKEYLDELIDRNIVEAIKVSGDGQVKTCQIHSLLRNLSIRKAIEELNLHILSHENPSTESLEYARHLVVYCNKGTFNILSRSRPIPRLHSLCLYVSTHGNESIPSGFWKRLGDYIRVLELVSLGLTMVPERICMLIGLKYLGLRNNQIQNLPRSLGNLINLETLDITGNENVEVPNVLWKLDALRHLYMPSAIICKECLKLDTLKNLQTLAIVSAKNIAVEHLVEMVSLRKLKLELTTDVDVDVNQLLAMLGTLENLSSLGLSWGLQHKSFLDGIVNLQRLTRIHIFGKLVRLPHLPKSLSYLKLCDTDLGYDPMRKLGYLPNLLHLKLVRNSYVSERMVIDYDGFPKLRILDLYGQKKLKEIYIENAGLPELKQLNISGCEAIKILPEEQGERMRRISN